MSNKLAAAPPSPISPLAPLSHPVFRMLWGTWLIANLCMWMNDVAAAWLMTSLTSSAVMVALVQAASTLPVFLLGVPSGALADILDRRLWFMATQFGVAAVGIVLYVAAAADWMSAPLLLALTFANGIGLAMRWPVFAAIVPEVVPRRELAAALALNGIAMNASRILGPLIAGALIASAGSRWVFLLNAVLSVVAGFTIRRWKRERKRSALPAERFFGAIRVGLQYVRQSPLMHATMLRASLFFLNSTALIALLPLLARNQLGGNASVFTVLLASMGLGAIIAALLLPRLRQKMTRDEIVFNGTLLQAAAGAVVAFANGPWVAAPAMLVAGMAWISVANTLAVAAQMGLPDWVRARGMAVQQMAMMGGSAVGAAVWGQLASVTSLRVSLISAAGFAVVTGLLTRRFKVGGRADEDLTPARMWKVPELAVPIETGSGPVMITVEYRVDPARADEFIAVMRESRRIRLRNGALSWELFRDPVDPYRWVEYFVSESWLEHLREQERLTASDVAVRDRKWAFHIGDAPPVVSRLIAQPITRR